MRMNNRYLDRLELLFWNIVIPLMTYSGFFRGCVRHAYAISRTDSKSLVWLPPQVFIWGCTGLLAGFILGLLGLRLW